MVRFKYRFDRFISKIGSAIDELFVRLFRFALIVSRRQGPLLLKVRPYAHAFFAFNIFLALECYATHQKFYKKFENLLNTLNQKKYPGIFVLYFKELRFLLILFTLFKFRNLIWCSFFFTFNRLDCLFEVGRFRSFC